MKNDYRVTLLALSLLALVAAGIMIGVHVSLVDVDPIFDDVPDADAVINSHARIVLALGTSVAAFIAWLVVGALTSAAAELTRPAAAPVES